MKIKIKSTFKIYYKQLNSFLIQNLSSQGARGGKPWWFEGQIVIYQTMFYYGWNLQKKLFAIELGVAGVYFTDQKEKPSIICGRL